MTSTLPDFRVRRSTLASRIGGFSLPPVVILLALMPFLFTPDVQDAMGRLFFFVIVGTMWNLLAGYAGMVSIGQQAFVGVGAYTMVALASLAGINPYVAVLAGIVIAGVIAVPVSFLVFRLNGGYFAIATWVVAEVVRQLVSRTPALNGSVGTLTLQSAALGPTPGWRSAYVFWIGLAATVVVVAVAYALMRSRLGAGFTAIRDEPVAAASLGVPVVRGKRIVFVVAAAGCALAGGLLALSTLQVRPDSMFRVDFAVWMIFIVVIGGLGTIEGPIIGALVFFALERWLSPFGTWYLVVLGVVAILVTLLLPRGLWGLLADRGVELFPVRRRLELRPPGGRPGTLTRTS